MTRSQMTLVIPLRKTNTGQEAVFFLGLKIWTRISHSINNIKITIVYYDAFLTHTQKRKFKQATLNSK